MTGGDRPEGPVSGRTRISSRALQRLAVALVVEAARVPAREVAVSLRDDAGLLTAAITLPAVIGDPARGSLVERGAALRASVTRGMGALAARRVEPVAVRYSGVHRERERRVS